MPPAPPTPAPAAAFTPEVLAALEVVKRAFGAGITLPTGPTVAELWTKYATAEKANLRSWNRSEVVGRRFVELWGERLASSLTMDDVDEWRATERQRITQRHRPTTPATRNRALIVLRRMLNWAVSRGLLTFNQLARLRLEKENNIRQTVLTDADVERIMAEADPFVRTIVLVLFDTGMRRSEVVKLRWEQIDELNCCIRLAGADTKNGRARRPHLSQRALTALLAMPRTTSSGTPSRYVFANPWTGKPYNPRHVYELYQRAVDRSGVKGANGETVTMHALRHAFIAKARRLRVPEKTVMGQTGHLTRIAFDRYGARVDDDELAAMMATMQSGKAVAHE